MATLEQWVNLEKDSAYTNDGDGVTLERCGHVTIQVRFKENGIPIGYKVNVTPVGNNNVQYSAAELSRNPNFRQMNRTRGIANSNEILLEDVRLPAAGGNTYKIEARDDKGNVVSTTATIITKRKLYYQVMHMHDSNGTVPPKPLSSLETHAQKYHIKLIKKEPEQKIPYIKTILVGKYDHSSVFKRDVARAWNLDRKYLKKGFAAAFCDYIARIDALLFSETIIYGKSNPHHKVSRHGNELIIDLDYFLYHALNDAHDKNKEWYIAGGIGRWPINGDAPDSILIPKDNVDIAGYRNFTYGGYRRIKIKLDSSLTRFLQKTKNGDMLKINLKLIVVVGWVYGFRSEYARVPIITSAKRSSWEDISPASTDLIWHHELGHRLGMVSYGDKVYSPHRDFAEKSKLPDAPSTLYGENRGVNDQGHQGPHCATGASYDKQTKTWSGTPGCVMFGAAAIGTKLTPLDYCIECGPMVRKLDLSR